MTGETTGEAAGSGTPALGTLDPDSVDRIDVHLERAMRAEGEETDFHVRHARQLLEACRER